MLTLAAQVLVTRALAAAPPPIVNGEHTSLYPQVVMLRHADPGWNDVFVCSGTLVAPEWILTAAHCVTDPYGYGLTEMNVFVGDEWTDDAAEIEAAEWFPHPDYYVSRDGSVIDNDLGLVRLPVALDLDPIPLNEDALSEADVGEVLRYVGWGASDDYAYDVGTLKRLADIPLVGLEDEFLLAYDAGGAATCGGDSGGAVLRIDGGRVTLVAAHTFGRDDDGTLCDGSTSGDTRVDLYVEWIRSYVGDEPEEHDTGDDTDPAHDDDAADEADDRGATDDEAPGGCACDTTSGGGVATAVLGLLAVVRRRRR